MLRSQEGLELDPSDERDAGEETSRAAPEGYNTVVPRFHCPFGECGMKSWAASSSLFRHVENLHLSNGAVVSPEFLESCDKRFVCIASYSRP